MLEFLFGGNKQNDEAKKRQGEEEQAKFAQTQDLRGGGAGISNDRIHMYNTIAHNLADRIRNAPNLARAELVLRHEWEPHLTRATEEGISIAALQSLFRDIIDPALRELRNHAMKE